MRLVYYSEATVLSVNLTARIWFQYELGKIINLRSKSRRDIGRPFSFVNREVVFAASLIFFQRPSVV